MTKRIIVFLLSISIALTMCSGISFASDIKIEIATEENVIQKKQVASMLENGLDYEMYDTYCEITGYTGSATEIVIPAEIEGVPVSSIGYEAFSGCTSLTNIRVPSSVTNIETRAFFCCSNLTSIEIPNSVTRIGDWAFGYCSGLTSIEIPNSVTWIGNSAFSWCIGLSSIIVEQGNPVYHSNNNCLIETESKLLHTGCKNSNIPFDGSVESIGEDAFKGCSGLLSIEIPNNVTSIGESAFGWCSELNSIIVEQGNPVYHSNNNCLIETKNKILHTGCKNSRIPSDGSVKNIGDWAFVGCSGLTSIEIPNSVVSIGIAAFGCCSGLTSIEIPNSVTSIGESAFEECSGLTSIKIPSSVTSIGLYAFTNCSNLTTMYYTGTSEQWNSISIGSGNQYLTSAELIFITEEPDLDQTIKEKTTVSEFAATLGDAFECVVYKGDIVVSSDSLIGTGMTIVVTNKATSETYTKEVVILGDVTGDGLVKAADYMRVKRSISNPDLLTGLYFEAGDINGDSLLKANDYMRIKRYIAGSYDIYV